MEPSQACYDLIEEFEGYRANVYKDTAGKRTIGIGHLIKAGEKFNEPMSHDDAVALLRKDAAHAAHGVDSLVEVVLEQHEFDALVCFVYNIGVGAFKESHCLICLNHDDFDGAANEMLKWDKSGGVETPGLLRRRKAEIAMLQGN